jgi:hypothetical protein
MAAVLVLGHLILTPLPGEGSELPKLLGCTTYSVGSTGYSISMGIMEAVQESSGIKIKVVPAGTDKAKILPLKEGMMHLSLFTGAGQYYATMGLDEFAEKDWGPQPLRMVYGCPEGAIAGMMVRGNSGIKTLSDLKGKRVTLIPASPACKSLHEGYMAFGGVTWDDVNIVQVSSWGAAWSSVIDGSADTAHCLINSAKAVELAASQGGIHWLPAPPDNKEGWAKLNEFCPYLRPYKATSGAGASEENPVQIASYNYGFVCYPDLAEEVVFQITKAIWNGYDDYSVKHPTLKLWTREGALDTEAFLTPYHPGAIKFFKEAGVWTADHEKRQAKLLHEEAVRMKK